MTKAVYAGSFDPIHSGHIDVLRRAVKTFGGVTLLIADNPSKTYKLLPEQRIKWIREILDDAGVNGVTIDYLKDQFLADYCREHEITHIVKGLRNGTDLENEMAQEWYTKKMNESVETIYFTCEEKKRYLSSSSIKSMTILKRTEFIAYLKKINMIDGMSDEKFEDYLWKIYTTYCTKKYS